MNQTRRCDRGFGLNLYFFSVVFIDECGELVFFSFFLLLPLKFVCRKEAREEVLVEVATRSLEHINNPFIYQLHMLYFGLSVSIVELEW